MARYAVFMMVAVVALAAAGCGPKPEETEPAPAATSDATAPEHPPGDQSGQQHTAPPAGQGVGATATAQLQPADASSGITGTVTFTQELGGVRVVADVSGLPPGKHGFHIHQNGECVPPFTSAGDHLNPWNMEHGCSPGQVRHLGDLANLEAGADDKAHYDQVIDKISLVDPYHQIAGKSILIHAGEDDCKTQPSGNSGDRIACAVITPAHQ